MNRAINSGSETPATRPIDAADSKPPALAPVPVMPSESPDMLAGALPGWDLLPASPFIRRAK